MCLQLLTKIRYTLLFFVLINALHSLSYKIYRRNGIKQQLALCLPNFYTVVAVIVAV